MNTLSYKTKSANDQTVTKNWVVVDVAGESIGRASSKIAKLLRGKHKPDFTPHVDCGENVIVINASKVTLSGKKWEQKQYIHYTGYPGGQRSFSANLLFSKFPERLIEKSVKGMLPKNKLGAKIFKNLKVFADSTHKYKELNPKVINLKEFK